MDWWGNIPLGMIVAAVMLPNVLSVEAGSGGYQALNLIVGILLFGALGIIIVYGLVKAIRQGWNR